MDLVLWDLKSQSASHRHPCFLPKTETVDHMRSFIGAKKVLARIIPKFSFSLSPLDDTVAGRQSNETITWSDDLRAAFKDAQRAQNASQT